MTTLTAYTLGCLTPTVSFAAYTLFRSLHYRAAWDQWTHGGFRRPWIVAARAAGHTLARFGSYSVFRAEYHADLAEIRADARAAYRLPWRWCPWFLYPPVWWWTVRSLFGVRA